MENNQASKTALSVAYMRAAHQILDGEPRLFADPLALALLGPGTETEILAHREKYQNPQALGLRSHVALRSRYAEDRLRVAVGRGVSQYLILGAGFDTFAWRQPDWSQGLTIFEIDHPASQAAKTQKLRAAGLVDPPNLRFAGIDFERESLAQGFARHGVDLAKPAFIAWLGVTMYLTKETVLATLRQLAALAPGSELVLSFMNESAPKGAAHRNLAARAESVGEPFINAYGVDELKGILAELNFRQIDFLTPGKSAPYFERCGAGLRNQIKTCMLSAIL